MTDLIIQIMDLLDNEVVATSKKYLETKWTDDEKFSNGMVFEESKRIRNMVQELIDDYMNEALKDYARKEGENDEK